MIDLIVTALRKDMAQRLVYSVSRGTMRPGMISIVTNEIDTLDPCGLNVRLIRFVSDVYPIGYKDVTIRCNVGLYTSEHQYVMFAGEDHVAALNTIETAAALLREKPFYFGHHRITTFNNKSVEQIQAMKPEEGQSREHGVNRQHLYQSAYSGSFGARRDVLEAAGGWDMAFACRHAGEDQQLGRRLSGDHVFIHEPPYWWHPSERYEWGKHQYTNLCDNHEFVLLKYNRFPFNKCSKCPFYKYVGQDDQLFTVQEPILQYEHSKVRVRIDECKESLFYGSPKPGQRTHSQAT